LAQIFFRLIPRERGILHSSFYPLTYILSTKNVEKWLKSLKSSLFIYYLSHTKAQ
jgi:hypothetical protein